MTTSSPALPGRKIANEDIVVIIPYYNGSKYIRRSALSVLSQTVPPAEFVVVDDGSTQEEAQKLDDIALELNFHVVRKKKRRAGIGAKFWCI